ncbi:MAG: hypothetical protein K6U78_16255 [Anaerolineae bacterium]|nr:hypothetical protein [Anaerolineae bacterium]
MLLEQRLLAALRAAEARARHDFHHPRERGINMAKRKKQTNLSPQKRLEVFLSCVEELRERPFVLDGLFKFCFHVSFDHDSGQLRCEFQEANQEYFRSFLLTLRKFIMNNEPANIDSILNICRKYVKNNKKELLKELKELKVIWSYQYRKGIIQMQTDGLNLTPEYVLDLWINGQYFHSDPDKERKLKDLLAYELPSVKVQLLWSLPILTQTVFYIGGVVSKALRQEAFEFPESIS